MKRVFLTVLFIFLSFSINAQTSKEIDFYGIVSSDIDENMIKMTEDLYINQLRDFSSNVQDFRYQKDKAHKIIDSITNAILPETKTPEISFAVSINKTGDALSKWECKVYLQCTEDDKILTLSREYDSYYKILMESKHEVSAMLESFISKTNDNLASTSKKSDADVSKPIQPNPRVSQTNDALDIFGTWTGEAGISKAVIMRGGRGFVIFRDGAAMNVLVSVDENDDKKTVNVKQSGNSNASYFTEIKRSDALENAKYAEPIEWNLCLVSENMLIGKKKTLLEDTNTGKIKNGTIDVEWVRK